MQNYQIEFIELAIHHQALRFGEFILKSGRKSPYFINVGILAASGNKLEALGDAYAHTIADNQIQFDMLFGPAYKGIPLVASTAISLARLYHKDIPYAFNRKEPKEHGEGGEIIGAAIQGRVLIIDDVMTAGTAIRHTIDLIKRNAAQVSGVVIALDRQERGLGEISTVQEISETFAIPVFSIIKLEDIVGYLKEKGKFSKAVLAEIEAYRQTFGV